MITVTPCPHGLGFVHIIIPPGTVPDITTICVLAREASNLALALQTEVERQEQAGKCTCCCHLPSVEGGQ